MRLGSDATGPVSASDTGEPWNTSSSAQSGASDVGSGGPPEPGDGGAASASFDDTSGGTVVGTIAQPDATSNGASAGDSHGDAAVAEPACTAGTLRYPTVQSVIDDEECLTVYAA